MTKAKYILLFIMVAMLILAFPSISNAADYATEPETVEYTRLIPSNEGTIKLNFIGLELDPAKPYEFALVRQGGTPENWFNIDDGYTTTTASITLSSGTAKIVDVLKATDTGFIYVREKNNTESNYVLEAYQVNLKLPYLQSLVYRINGKEYKLAESMLYNAIGFDWDYGNNRIFYQWEKVTSEEIVTKFLDIKNNEKSIVELENYLPGCPDTGYLAGGVASSSGKDDGLYLLWVKRTGENCKDVYSCIVHDGLKEATTIEQYIAGIDVEKPTVQSIAVTSPESGTYKTGQTVKITVTFSENITGETVPTLKIKFGTSEERTVTNGTISGKTIVYSYNIVDGDKGQLAVTGYAGGTIKDAAGNDAVISSKVISGNTIKANVEGTTTNNTQNQDKETNGGTTGDKGTGTGTTNNKEENKNDKTQATGKIPHAGVEIGIVFIMLVVVIAGVVVYTRYNKMKDIL